MKKSNQTEFNAAPAPQSNGTPDSESSGNGASASPTHEAIAQAAYALWEKDGGAHGRDHEHWLEAERQLRRPGNPAYPTLEKREAMVKAATGEKTDTRRIPADDLKKFPAVPAQGK